MKRILCLPLALLSLAGCGKKPELHTGARTPAPAQVEVTVESAPTPTGGTTGTAKSALTPSPSPSPEIWADSDKVLLPD